MKNKIKKITIILLIATMTNVSTARAQGTHALGGMLLGATTVGLITSIAMVGYTTSYYGYENSDGDMFLASLGGFALGAVTGGVIGAGIGSMIPKANKFQITPTIAPTPNGISAGANLRINF